MAQVYAERNAIRLELHFLNFDKFARGAWWHRSEHIIDASDFIILIHDGISKGASNELDQVKKHKKPHQYIVLPPTDGLQRTKRSGILRGEADLGAMDFDFSTI